MQGVKRVLIADDSEAVRTAIRESLQGATLVEVYEAKDGHDALTEASKLKPDLVILDMRMPYVGGIEAAVIMRSSMPGIRIILMSIDAEEIGKRSMLTKAIPVDAVISKSDGIGPLIEAVQRLLFSTNYRT